MAVGYRLLIDFSQPPWLDPVAYNMSAQQNRVSALGRIWSVIYDFPGQAKIHLGRFTLSRGTYLVEFGL